MKIIGSGEIEEVVKGKVYRIRHHLGRDPKTGRYIRSPKKTVYGTKADARRALEEYRVELECGVKNPEELTVGNYARAWYERRKNTGRYSPLTLKDDELQVRKIEDIWGATLLEDLTLKKISDAYDKLLASKKATKSAIHKLNATLSLVMDEAVANELVEANPCEHVKAPRPKPKERKTLSDEQALELAVALRTEEQTGCTVAVWIALATGMRRGEILGLVWRNVDFERKRIYVGQQYAADHKIRDPKSEKSHRWLGLDDGTVALLAEWRRKPAATERPALSEADKAAIAQRMADGASLEAAITAVRPDVSALQLLGL